MNYTILVGDVLIRVAQDHVKPTLSCDRDEEYLLEVLKDIWASPLRLLRYLKIFIVHINLMCNISVTNFKN
jgi:hypothetical protein